MADHLKKAVFAVAGSGKTTMLVDSLSHDKRTLLLTYTDANADQLYNAIVKKFGCLPGNIMVSTWFSFLLNFLIKPFVIAEAPDVCRLEFSLPPRYEKGMPRYLKDDESLFHSRAFDFAMKYVGKEKMCDRIEKFFDEVLIDEVQDFSGYDFDFIEMLGNMGIDVVLTGDFFQHTYDTSCDGAKNKGLHDDLDKYEQRLHEYYSIDKDSLSKSHRCPAAVCDFVNSHLGLEMHSCSKATSIAPPYLLCDKQKIQDVLEDNGIKKLFYKESRMYKCNGANWGDCKGLSYEHVCVVLNNKTATCYDQNRLSQLPPTTRNKFYVACTRTKGPLLFIREADITAYKRPKIQPIGREKHRHPAAPSEAHS